MIGVEERPSTDMNTDEATLDDFKLNQRVELHPATDRWMMGDRYGVVTKVDTEKGVVRVRLDVSCKSLDFFPYLLLKRCP